MTRDGGWTASKQRGKYQRMKAEGRCVVCTGTLLPEWTGVMCPECAERHAIAQRERGWTDEQRQRRNERQRARYVRLNYVSRQRELRHAKKARGECIRCTDKAAEDSNYCERHRESERVRIRNQARRRRAAQRAQQESV